MNIISKDELWSSIFRICIIIIENEPKLTEIDTIIGDGDHGIGMKRGFTAVREMLEKNTDLKPYGLLHATGIELVRTMGGASGVLFGSLFTGGSKTIPKDADHLSLEEMASFFQSGTDTIMQRGKAILGDKTMLDALVPAAKEFSISVAQGKGKKECFENAWKASVKGVEDTVNMKSKKGRSKNFQDLTIGYPDPGAVSISLIFQGFMEK